MYIAKKNTNENQNKTVQFSRGGGGGGGGSVVVLKFVLLEYGCTKFGQCEIIF